jgi:hypothetical protein
MKTLISIFFLLQILLTYGQENETYSPRILILSPSEFKFDTKFKLFFDTLKLNSGIANEDVSNHPENIQQTIKSVQNYEKNSGYKGIVPLTIAQRMLFTMFRGERNFVVLMDTVTLKNITANNLAKLAKDYNVQHIVYFPLNEVFYKDDIGYGRIKLSVYDATLNKTTLDLEEIDNWIVNEEYDNPEKSSLQNPIGLLFNASYFTWFRILETVYENNVDYKKQKREFFEKQKLEDDEEFTSTEEDRLYKKIIEKELGEEIFNTNIPNEILSEINQRKYLSNSNLIFDFHHNEEKTMCYGFILDTIDRKNTFYPEFNTVNIEEKLYNFNIPISENQLKNKQFGYLFRGYYEDSTWYFDEVLLHVFENGNFEDNKKILRLYDVFFGSIDYFETKYYPLSFDKEDDHYSNKIFNTYDYFEDRYKYYPYTEVLYWDKKKSSFDNYRYEMFIKSNNYILERDFIVSEKLNLKIKPFLKLNSDETINNFQFYISKNLDYFIVPTIKSNDSIFIVFDLNNDQIFQWTNAKIDISGSYEDIINSITVLRKDCYNTIIDEQFWNEEVFKKVEGKYSYLRSIK